jgi:serine/threonine-protein kinase
VRPPPPQSFGRYEIEEEIGRGMMGVVYKARDPLLGRTVALKTVELAFTIAEAERTVFEQRFLSEARLAAQLSHPNIVVVHDVGGAPGTGTLFIAFEFLKGRTLDELTTEGSTMDWREALRIAARVGRGLHHAHSQGVVHRDIKPSNIMVLPSGEPKIMDFGIAKAPMSQLTAAGEFFGTPAYMSPEQACGAKVDGRSDVFSLGAVLYRLLTGRRAFEGDSVPAILGRVASEAPEPPSSIVPGLPPELDTIIARALAKRPEERYPDGLTFAEDVEDVLQGRPLRVREGLVAGAVGDRTLVRRRAGNAPAALPGRAPGATSLVLRLSDRVGAGGFLAIAGLVLAALLLARLAPKDGDVGGARPAAPSPLPAAAGPPTGPSPLASPSPSPSPRAKPGRIALSLEHGLKTATLKVWVDDGLALQKRLTGTPAKRLFKTVYRGREAEVIYVSPGEHTIRVQVDGDGKKREDKIKRTFRSGETELLEVKVNGKVDLGWKS